MKESRFVASPSDLAASYGPFSPRIQGLSALSFSPVKSYRTW
jgi:hypothetical protein